MNKPTILFLSRARCDAFFIEIINNLKQDYNIVVAVTDENRALYAAVEGIALEDWHDEEINKAEIEKLTAGQLEQIKDIEKTLGMNCYHFNINYFLYEKFVNRYANDLKNKAANAITPQRLLLDYNLLDAIIKKHDVKYAFFETVDLLNTTILTAMAKQGIIKQAFAHEINPIGGEMRVRIVSGQHRRSNKLEQILKHNLISAESMAWAEQAVAKYRTEKPQTGYDAYHAKMGEKMLPYSPKEFLSKIKRSLHGESLLPAIIRLKNRLLSKKYFSNELPEGKIVSYFLQLTPEATMCSQVPEFANQEHMLEQIAIHGKYGYTVVIKEHPAGFGNRPPSFYRELVNLPNVVMLAPSFPTREVILRSEAVVVATGTSPGLESIATNVPVICLGNPFFNLCKNTASIEHPRQVWDVIESIKADPAETVRFVAGLHQASYEYSNYVSKEEFMVRKNCGELVAKGLAAEISLYESGELK